MMVLLGLHNTYTYDDVAGLAYTYAGVAGLVYKNDGVVGHM